MHHACHRQRERMRAKRQSSCMHIRSQCRDWCEKRLPDASRTQTKPCLGAADNTTWLPCTSVSSPTASDVSPTLRNTSVSSSRSARSACSGMSGMACKIIHKTNSSRLHLVHQAQRAAQRAHAVLCPESCMPFRRKSALHAHSLLYLQLACRLQNDCLIGSSCARKAAEQCKGCR